MISAPPARYVLLTGLPRSGTSLAAALLDGLDGVVCLHEPARYYGWAATCESSGEFARRCRRDLDEVHATLAEGGSVLDVREADGRAPTDYFDADGGRRPLRPHPVSRPLPLAAPLLVGVKHNEPFTAALPELIRMPDSRIIATVRRPLPTLLSWRRTAIPLSAGRLSAGYRLWPEAHAARGASRSIAELHVRLYELYCRRFVDYAGGITLLRHEDLADGCAPLDTCVGRARRSPAPPRSPARRPPEDSALVGELCRLMAAHFDCAASLYPEFDRW